MSDTVNNIFLILDMKDSRPSLSFFPALTYLESRIDNSPCCNKFINFSIYCS